MREKIEDHELTRKFCHKFGAEIRYGKYSYWDSCPYLYYRGRNLGFLVTTYYHMNGAGLRDLTVEELKDLLIRAAHVLREIDEEEKAKDEKLKELLS